MDLSDKNVRDDIREHCRHTMQLYSNNGTAYGEAAHELEYLDHIEAQEKRIRGLENKLKKAHSKMDDADYAIGQGQKRIRELEAERDILNSHKKDNLWEIDQLRKALNKERGA